ncbi:hypothetical protein A7318_12805 [Pseudomonas lurida]|nr:hypothetical protein A7318_12805 [Pseudomonas lurida]
MSFLDKFDLHFYDRFPGIMSTYWQVYLVIIVSLLAVCIIVVPNRKHLLYAGVFFIGAVLSNAAFIGSPFVPERAYNGALVLMLISLSFVMSVVFDSEVRRIKTLYAVAVSAFILVYFVPSYLLFSNAVINVWAQSKMRESIIVGAKAKGLKEVQVPSYYYTKLLKPSDKLASFDNNAVDLYYGLDRISYYTAPFNYAGIERLPKADVSLPVIDGVLINRIYAYDDGFGRGSKLLFRVDGNISAAFAGGVFMYVHVFLKDGTYVNRDTAVPTMQFNGSNYTFSELGVDYEKIDRIELGMYRTTGTISSFVIKDPKFIKSN